MTSKKLLFRRHPHRQPCLTFAPLAWAKLQFFCHLGDTEIAGFGITAKNDLIYVEDFVTVRQHTSPMTVVMDDAAVADYSDRCVDAGLAPQRFLRIWCHTHPGSSPRPSGTDEDTFARVFGASDWAVMFILSRTAETYARLSFHSGPGASMEIPVRVDWSTWPKELTDLKIPLVNLLVEWQQEFAANIQRLSAISSPLPGELPTTGSPWEPVAATWDWTDLERELLEEYERHEHSVNSDYQS